LAISAAPGTDIAFSEEKIKSYRAFANKIWNAGRFILMNLRKLPEPMQDNLTDALEPLPGIGFEPVAGPEDLALADRWIFSRLQAVTRAIEEALASYRFHEAAYVLYHFFWHEFCDWYLEWVKPEITRAPEANLPGPAGKLSPAWINLVRVFEAALRLLHPFMPFITEELWHQLPHRGAGPSISLAGFSLVSERVADPVSEKQFQVIQESIVSARNAKANMGLQKQRPSAQVASDDLRILTLLRTHQETVLRLAALQALNFTRGRLAEDLAGVHISPDFDLRLLHEEKIDHEAERARLQKDKERLEQQLAQLARQLENQAFRENAPRDVVRGVEHRHAELCDQYRKVLASLERLG
jgi:valyl-tRNA synthetase